MTTPCFRILSVALAVFTACGAALAQTPNTGPHTTFGSSGNVAGTTSTGTVTINTSTGTITNADGTVTTLLPGQTVFVLPSAGTTVSAGTAISGIVVPTDSAVVRAILAGFAGSLANLSALEQGLINRTVIALTGPSGNATFTSPATSMTQADSTQALLLATSQLASLGIAQPSPQQIQASLVGGTVTAANGQSVALTGVLQLRRQGLNFVQIAQTLGTQAALGVQGTTAVTTAPAGPRDTSRAVVGRGNVRQDAGASSTAGTTTTTTTTAATSTGGSTSTGSTASPPLGSATRGSPSATGGAGLR